jgi:hypothetical protein
VESYVNRNHFEPITEGYFLISDLIFAFFNPIKIEFERNKPQALQIKKNAYFCPVILRE